MKRFIVCDDDPQFVEYIAQTLHELYDRCTVEHMYGPDALEASLRMDAGSADVLLADIQLRSRSAIQIIQKHLKPSTSMQVIYISGYINYCTAVYDTPHSSFLVKPVSREELKKAVDRAFASLELSRATRIPIKISNATSMVSQDELIYAESSGRRIRIVTAQEELETYSKLSSLAQLLDGRFLICHKSFLVNMDYVKLFSGTSFLMNDGTEIPISQTKRKSVRQSFFHYIGNLSQMESPC